MKSLEPVKEGRQTLLRKEDAPSKEGPGDSSKGIVSGIQVLGNTQEEKTQNGEENFPTCDYGLMATGEVSEILSLHFIMNRKKDQRREKGGILGGVGRRGGMSPNLKNGEGPSTCLFIIEKGGRERRK